MEVVNVEQHPLLNGVVLDNLVSFVSLEDLAIFRQVCHTWYLSSVRKWRLNKTLIIKSFDARRSYAREIESKSNALNGFYKLDKYPYRKMKVVKNIRSALPGIGISNSYYGPTLRFKATFWNHNRTLTHLTLSGIILNSNINYFLEVILFKLTNLTDLVFERNFWKQEEIARGNCYWIKKPVRNNLKRFTLIGFEYGNGGDAINVMYIPWRDFFRHFTGLESLEIKHVINCFCSNTRDFLVYQYFTRLITEVKRWEKNATNIPLKRLKLHLAQPIPDGAGRRKRTSGRPRNWDLFGQYITPVRLAEQNYLAMYDPLIDLRLPNLVTLSMTITRNIYPVPDVVGRLMRRFPFIDLNMEDI